MAEKSIAILVARKRFLALYLCPDTTKGRLAAWLACCLIRWHTIRYGPSAPSPSPPTGETINPCLIEFLHGLSCAPKECRVLVSGATP